MATVFVHYLKKKCSFLHKTSLIPYEISRSKYRSYSRFADCKLQTMTAVASLLLGVYNETKKTIIL